MPLSDSYREQLANAAKSTDKKEGRESKKKSKRDFKLEKIKAVTAKAIAVGTKRKWLVFLIGAAIAAYFVLKGGGLGGLFKSLGGG